MNTDTVELAKLKAEALQEWNAAVSELACFYWDANVFSVAGRKFAEVGFWYEYFGDGWEWRSSVPRDGEHVTSKRLDAAFNRATAAGDKLIRIMVGLEQISPDVFKVKLLARLKVIEDGVKYTVDSTSIVTRIA
jgi:hypothetical protein